jgi:hypothetical protein
MQVPITRNTTLLVDNQKLTMLLMRSQITGELDIFPVVRVHGA